MRTSEVFCLGVGLAAGAGMVLFPELSVCGYPPRDLVERPAFLARNRETVERIATETRGIAVVCGFVSPARADTAPLRVIHIRSPRCSSRDA